MRDIAFINPATNRPYPTYVLTVRDQLGDTPRQRQCFPSLAQAQLCALAHDVSRTGEPLTWSMERSGSGEVYWWALVSTYVYHGDGSRVDEPVYAVITVERYRD